MYIKFIGIRCTAACGILIGNAAAHRLKERFERLDSIIASLSIIKAKLALNLTPIPDILSELSSENHCAVYGEIYRRYSFDEPFSDTWCSCFSEYAADLGDETVQILCGLGQMLGKYDASEQCEAIDYALLRLGKKLDELRSEYAEQGRLYRKLGVALGLGTAVMLM